MIPDSQWVRRAAVAVTIVDGALIVEHAAGGRAMRLDAIARDVWEQLEYPADVPALTRRLRTHYTGDPSAIEADVRDLLDALLEEGLVELLPPASALEMHQQRYLWLLKRALVDALNAENEMRLAVLQSATVPPPGLERQRFLRDIRYRLPHDFADLEDARRIGHLWCTRYAPKLAHTTIGLSGLENLERCAEIVFREHVDGDFLEAGVLAGGAAIFMRGLQRTYGESHRSVWVADSFRGLPPSTADPDVAAGLDLTEPHVPWLCRTVEAVRDNFRQYDLLDDCVRFVEGWLAESLPAAPISRLAVLRIDVDLYQSTLDVLQSLYANVTPGGFVIVDDYGLLMPCQQAVDEFRSNRDISSPLLRVDQQRVFWRKDT